MPGPEMQVVTIAGSLRRGSFNAALLDAAEEVAPAGMRFTRCRLHGIPLYDYDVEQNGDPEPVRDLKGTIAAADAVVIATPEYQQGVPGVLKNALDWASRPPGESPLQGKPVAIMGATPGMGGTGRAQTQLRQTLVYNGCPVLPAPEVLVARVHDKVDDAGRLVHERTRGFVADAMTRLAAWVPRFAT